MKWKRVLTHGFTIVLLLVLFCIPCKAENSSESKSEMEKESYSIGYQFGGNLRRQKVDLDLTVIVEGIRDAYEGKDSKLSAEQMDDLIKGLKKKVWIKQQNLHHEIAVRNLREGEAFLAENAKKEGVKTLPSGLQYKVLREGTGPNPKAADTVTVQYRGILVDGTEFDSSYSRREPSTMHVFGMIPGWAEALQLMKAGAKWQIFVPAKLGYGERRQGRIPPNSVMIFELELLSVQEGPFPANVLLDNKNGILEPSHVRTPQKPSNG
jgi:FKBP-type peptidyl-prolyl cis-trans isomerase FklB